jgi:hypothetical protein
MKLGLYKYGIVVAVLGGFYLYTVYDKGTNYEEIMARVIKVEETCYLKKTSRGIGTKTTSTTKEGPCDIVEAINEGHPEFQDYRLIRTTYVEYEYRSPADGEYYTGRHTQSNHEDGTAIRYGSDILILAHKEKPETTRRK